MTTRIGAADELNGGQAASWLGSPIGLVTRHTVTFYCHGCEIAVSPVRDKANRGTRPPVGKARSFRVYSDLFASALMNDLVLSYSLRPVNQRCSDTLCAGYISVIASILLTA